MTQDQVVGSTRNRPENNIRFPFTAVGMRVDLNRGKWHGPNSGNYDEKKTTYGQDRP